MSSTSTLSALHSKKAKRATLHPFSDSWQPSAQVKQVRRLGW